MERVACNLCGSQESMVLYADLPDMLLRRREVTATLVRCCACGLIYQNPRPTREEIGQHYPDRYDSYNYRDDVRKGCALSRWAAAYGIAKRCRYVTRHKRGGVLLDVGCSTGLFLQGMRKHGYWQLCGVEPSNYAASIARQKGLEVITGTLENTAFPAESFDAVTMWDVIEHVHDPLGTLHYLAHILRPDGLLVIRTPNFDSWDARLFGPYWSGFEPPRHLHIFTPHTISAALKQCGFTPIQIDCRSGGYMAFLLSLRFKLSYSRMSSQSQERLLRLLYHPISRMLAAPIFTLSGMGLKGPQMVVVAAREAVHHD
ncbi:MAG: class I SAM-dependent methyltransferase [Anaerolineae bacterium]|jgi:SAM-dependent methyltransferase|nr:class I SAM-dependent methyltransferase [Anaerolineae bacterium]